MDAQAVTPEELEGFRESISRFLDDAITEARFDAWEKAKMVDRDIWREAAALGMLGLSVPSEYGGMDGDFRHERIVIEEMGARGLEGWAVPLHNAIVAPYLIEFGTEAQKRKWLPRVCSGEAVLAIAMTEPGAGSDLQGMRSRAVLNGDHYVLSGSKTFISNGQSADLVLVACKTDPDARSKGISILLVEADSPGFERGRNLDKIGRDAQDTSELFFNDVIVPAENVLGGEPGRGFAQMMSLLPQERLTIAAMGLAMLERALALAITYSKERNAFGKPLAEFQNTAFVLAEIKTEATIARAFIDQCAARLVEGTLDTVTASMAKLWVTEREVAGITRCLQIFGGYGYMNEYPIARLFRDSRIDTIHGGTSEVMKIVISRSL